MHLLPPLAPQAAGRQQHNNILERAGRLGLLGHYLVGSCLVDKQIGREHHWLVKFEFQLESKRRGGRVITILVLDDDVFLLDLLCSLLQRHGYRALAAGSAEEALRQFHDNHRQIDLLIADVTLPIGSGIQVALALRAELPDLRVILASGYPSQTWSVRDFTLLGRLGPESVSILQKPFASQILLSTIGELIGVEQAAAARTA